MLAACQVAPPIAPRVPPPAPRVTYSPAHFDALPGWRDDRVEAVWPAFLVGCRALATAAASQSIWQAPCAAATLVVGNDGAAVRAYFENNFSYTGSAPVTAPTRDSSPVTTNRCWRDRVVQRRSFARRFTAFPTTC